MTLPGAPVRRDDELADFARRYGVPLAAVGLVITLWHALIEWGALGNAYAAVRYRDRVADKPESPPWRLVGAAMAQLGEQCLDHGRQQRCQGGVVGGLPGLARGDQCGRDRLDGCGVHGCLSGHWSNSRTGT